MAYRSFEELDVWKRSCALAVTLYEMMKDVRDYGLRNQMQRASISIPSNIAEGAERGGRDFVRFLRVASGSAAELRTQVYIARRLDIVSAAQSDALLSELKAISKMPTGLRQSLDSQN